LAGESKTHPPPSAGERKRELRRFARSLVSQTTGSAAARRAIAAQERLLALLEDGGGLTVALYSAIEHEVPLERVARSLAGRGDRIAFPRVRDRTAGGLVLHRAGPEDLVPGFGGILEPEARAPVVEPTDVDVFVVPGLLFDPAGRRLGRGAGHYDALLAVARSDALRLGLCYAERVVPEIPAESHDEPVQCVVTDAAVLQP